MVFNELYLPKICNFAGRLKKDHFSLQSGSFNL